MILTGEKEPIHISPSQIKQHKPRTKAGAKTGSKKSSNKKGNVWSSDEDDDHSDKENQSQDSQPMRVAEQTPVRSSRSRRAKK